MRYLLAFAGLALAWLTAPVAAAIPAIAYHDIVERRGADTHAITLEEFRAQLDYLQREGYTPIRLADLAAARAGKWALPSKPVLLTFDDGLASFERHALPLLRRYDFPAVLAVVTGWLDGDSAPPAYRGRLLTWESLKRLRAGGGVEIISHSHNLHHGITANPQGNKAPAIVTREYGGPDGYETETQFRARIRRDLTRSHERLRTVLGIEPLAIAWPFGQYDAVTIEEALRLGFQLHLTLNEEPNTLEGLPAVNRSTFFRYRSLSNFDDMLTARKWRTEQLRFVEIDLDEIAAGTIPEQERAISALLARIELLGVNAVVVRPLSRDGQLAYFPNNQVPVAADLLNRAIHQIHARNRIDHIYLRLPASRDGVSLAAAYRELARLNRFAGVLLEGSGSDRDTRALQTMFRQHHPAVKFALPADRGGTLTFADLTLEKESGVDTAAVQAALGAAGRVLFVLRRTPDVPDHRLAQAMRALRDAGAVDYGYAGDEFLAGRPARRVIVPELTAHAIRRP